MNIKNRIKSLAKKTRFSRSLWHFYQSFVYFIKHPFPAHNKKNREGAVVQLMITFVDKNAIGNAAIEISKMLSHKNIRNYIVYEGALSFVENGVPINNFKFNKKDIIIYHMSTGCNMSNIFKNIEVKNKILYYHNITPSKYFYDMSEDKKMSELGRKQLADLKDCTDIALCVSDYNSSELKKLGYKNIKVVGIPTIIDGLLKRKSSKSDDGKIKLLTVGRIARHKCIDDIIKVFNEFISIENKSELYIVGNCLNKTYEKELIDLIKKLELSNYIHFKPDASEDELANCYSNADAYICMSEHEGFCVPLVEAMAFNVPVFAYNSSAIKETLGDYGYLFKNKNYKECARKICYFVNNKDKIITDRYTQLKSINDNRMEEFIKCLML